MGHESINTTQQFTNDANNNFKFKNLIDDSREKAFNEINKFFNSSLPKKIDFFVWNSKDDAKRIFHKNLGFAEPSFCIVNSHFQQTIGHELTHVISHYTTSISKKTRFINEGTAVCFDQTNHGKNTMFSPINGAESFYAARGFRGLLRKTISILHYGIGCF